MNVQEGRGVERPCRRGNGGRQKGQKKEGKGAGDEAMVVWTGSLQGSDDEKVLLWRMGVEDREGGERERGRSTGEDLQQYYSMCGPQTAAWWHLGPGWKGSSASDLPNKNPCGGARWSRHSRCKFKF